MARNYRCSKDIYIIPPWSHKFKNFGLGGALYTDVTGPTSKTGMYLSYAYHIRVANETKLSLGLSGGLMQYSVDGTKINLASPGDLTLANTLMTRIVLISVLVHIYTIKVFLWVIRSSIYSSST